MLEIKQILLLLKIIFLCKCQQISDVSPDQAMQMASKMKACVPVKPGENLGNYKEKILGQWFVVKMYDAPLEENHPIPPFVFSKHPVTNQIIVDGECPRKFLLIT